MRRTRLSLEAMPLNVLSSASIFSRMKIENGCLKISNPPFQVLESSDADWSLLLAAMMKGEVEMQYRGCTSLLAITASELDNDLEVAPAKVHTTQSRI